MIRMYEYIHDLKHTKAHSLLAPVTLRYLSLCVPVSYIRVRIMCVCVCVCVVQYVTCFVCVCVCVCVCVRAGPHIKYTCVCVCMYIYIKYTRMADVCVYANTMCE
jgi:hypothetical protein